MKRDWLETIIAGELLEGGKPAAMDLVSGLGKYAADGAVYTRGQVYAALMSMEKNGLVMHREPPDGRPWRWELTLRGKKE
jgi:DNA-binding PadR family transcriptional regulator